LIRAFLCAVAVVFFALPATSHAAPGNDNLANAIPISIGGFLQGTNVDATVQNPETLTSTDGSDGCEADGTAGPDGFQITKTVWWRFTGNGEPLTVSTTLSDFDTIVAVHTAVPEGLVLQGCNDDAGPGELGSEVVIPTDAGEQYFIQVGGCDQCPANGGGFTDNEGVINLALDTPPQNDSRSGASPLTLGANADDFTFGALSDQGETLTCGTTAYDKTVWYRFTVPAPGTATITASGFPLSVSAYAGTQRVGCTGGSGSSALLRTRVGPGTTYFVQVGGRGQGTGAEAGHLNLRVDFARDVVPPADSDGDGVPDSSDRCPGQSSAGRDADRDGCLDPDPDPDRDGVLGGADKCPTQSSAARDKNRDGCLDPAPRKRISADARLRATPTASGLRIVYLRVIAPKGSKITVRCGRRCKFAKKAAASGNPLATAARTVAIKKLAGRSFRAGQRIRIYVTRKGRIGAYIQYTVTRGGFKRVNRCLNPGSTKPRKRCR
jgi:hypothetical protein